MSAPALNKIFPGGRGVLLYGLVRFLTGIFVGIFPFLCLGFSHFFFFCPSPYSAMEGRVLLSDSSLLVFNNFPFLIRKWICCLFCSLCQNLFVLQPPSKFFMLALDRWLLYLPSFFFFSLSLTLQDFNPLHYLDHSSNPQKCIFCVARAVEQH